MRTCHTKILPFIFWIWCSITLPIYSQESRIDTQNFLLRAVQNGWRLPEKLDTTSKEVSSPNVPLPSNEDLSFRTQRIILPRLNFNNLPFCQAIKVLTELVRTYDLKGDGINFVLIDPEHRAPNVDLDLQSVSLKKVITYIQEQTKFDVIYDEKTIVFRDKHIQNENLVTKIFPIPRGNVLQILNYSLNKSNPKSEEEYLKDFFEKLGIPFSEKGVGFAYDGQNVVVTHKPSYLEKINEIICLYRQSKQITIETKFLEIQQGVLEELGLKWNSGDHNNVHVNTASTLRNLSSFQNTTNTQTPTFPNALNLGANVSNLLDANVFLNRYQMNMLVRAIEQRSDTDLMSAPKVTVLSGRKAEIVVAQELRYPESYRDGRAEVGQAGTGSTSAGTALIAGVPEHFVTRNIGVEMTVTPIAEGGDKIHLCLEPCVTEFEGFVPYGGSNVVTYGANSRAYDSGYYQPIFSTRKIKTEVSLSSGSTLVMGGLTREEVKETRDKIPILGQIPLFGKLFTSKGQTSLKKNLLIFVTANLVDGNGKCFTKSELPLSQKL